MSLAPSARRLSRFDLTVLGVAAGAALLILLGYSASAIKGVDLETPKPKKTWWQRLWGKG